MIFRIRGQNHTSKISQAKPDVLLTSYQIHQCSIIHHQQAPWHLFANILFTKKVRAKHSHAIAKPQVNFRSWYGNQASWLSNNALLISLKKSKLTYIKFLCNRLNPYNNAKLRTKLARRCNIILFFISITEIHNSWFLELCNLSSFLSHLLLFWTSVQATAIFKLKNCGCDDVRGLQMLSC